MTKTLDAAVPTFQTRAIPADLVRARSLHDRLNRALADLGLGDALTPRWATPARSGFFFAPHNLHQATRLVHALEHLGHSVDGAGDPGVGPRPGVDSGSDQLVLPLGRVDPAERSGVPTH
jgi:hypothetical protein